MERLDHFLVRLGLLPSRETARQEIQAGQVLVNGVAMLKPGYKLRPEDKVEYIGAGRGYVSRGACKLLGAIEAFALDFTDKRCLDVGASTGGFTQVMLEHGAKGVTALDVGHGQLDERIKSHPAVRELSGVNFRALSSPLREELINFDFLTMDVSFISVCLMVESVKAVLKEAGEALILIKPQFEAGRGALNKNGVVTDQNKHAAVLTKVLNCYLEAGFVLEGLTHSPIRGPQGNIEYLCFLTLSSAVVDPLTQEQTQGSLPELARQAAENAFTYFQQAGSKQRGS